MAKIWYQTDGRIVRVDRSTDPDRQPPGAAGYKMVPDAVAVSMAPKMDLYRVTDGVLTMNGTPVTIPAWETTLDEQVAALVLKVATIQPVIANMPQALIAAPAADLATNLNALTTLLGVLTGEVNKTNAKVNALIATVNSLIAELKALGLMSAA